MVHGKNRIPYRIDRRLTGLAGPDYDATVSFGLPIEPEDSQYGEYRLTPSCPQYEEALPLGFYNAQPQERVAALYQTTSNLRDNLMTGLPDWPIYSPGSLNAWLVFLGPSPGNSPGGLWNYDPLPSFGRAHGGVAEYRDRRGFWNGIREYARAIFPELSPANAYAATMVRNLDPKQSATAPTGGHMYPAAVQVTEILGRLVRPRLVIALGGARKHTDKAFQNVASINHMDSGTLYTAKKGNECRWFSLKGSWHTGEPFLYVSPTGIHPSLAHVSRQDSLRFLDQQSKVARSL